MPQHSGLSPGFHAYRCGGSAGLFTGFPFKPRPEAAVTQKHADSIA